MTKLEQEYDDIKKQIAELNKRLDDAQKIMNDDEPKVGDFCKFTNPCDQIVYGKLIDKNRLYKCEGSIWFQCCEKATFSPDSIDLKDVYNNPERYEAVFHEHELKSLIKKTEAWSYILRHLEGECEIRRKK